MKETEQTLLDQEFKNKLAIELIARFTGNSRGTPIAKKSFADGAMWALEQMDMYATAKAKASCEATPVSAPSESQEELWKKVFELSEEEYVKPDHSISRLYKTLCKAFTITRNP